MLGLSSGIIAPQAPSSRQLIGTYTADWSSDVDGWTNMSENDSDWTLARVASFGGKSNVLRADVTSDETGTSGFGKFNFTNSPKQGDYIELTCDIYLDSTQGAGNRWDGSDDISMYLHHLGAYDYPFVIEQDKWASISTVQGATLTNASINEIYKYKSDLSSFNGNDIYMYFPVSNDMPLNGARLYVANLVAKHYRSQLFT